MEIIDDKEILFYFSFFFWLYKNSLGMLTVGTYSEGNLLVV